MQRRHGNVPVLDGLIVRAVVRLPLVLPFFDPVVRLSARIDPFLDPRDVIALALHRAPEAQRRPFRDVDVKECTIRQPMT